MVPVSNHDFCQTMRWGGKKGGEGDEGGGGGASANVQAPGRVRAHIHARICASA